jgi:hypothetical protein
MEHARATGTSQLVFDLTVLCFSALVWCLRRCHSARHSAAALLGHLLRMPHHSMPDGTQPSAQHRGLLSSSYAAVYTAVQEAHGHQKCNGGNRDCAGTSCWSFGSRRGESVMQGCLCWCFVLVQAPRGLRAVADNAVVVHTSCLCQHSNRSGGCCAVLSSGLCTQPLLPYRGSHSCVCLLHCRVIRA